MNYLKFNGSDILFRPAINEYLSQTVIGPKVEAFLLSKNIKMEEAVLVRGRASITDLNFDDIDTKYFYNKLLKDVKKRAKDGKGYKWSRYYTITFDDKLVNKECEKTGLRYNELYLGKEPILFFIYFSVQEILDEVRNYALNSKSGK